MRVTAVFVLSALVAVPGALPAAAQGTETLNWSTTVAVGNMYGEGSWIWPNGEYMEEVVETSEWERGYRRQYCVMQLDDTDVAEEERTKLDTCYGSIGDRTFDVGGTSYEVEGVYHYTATGNDQLSLAFTGEVDLTPLLDKTLRIDGVSFLVADRSSPSGPRGRTIAWSAPQWTKSMGWIVGNSIAVALGGAPTVSGTPSVTDPGDGAWSPGETVDVTLTFSEAVDVDTTDGTPSLEIGLGAAAPTRNATYASGSGTTELVFSYTLGDDDGSHTSMFVTADSLTLNDGTVRSTATGVDATLTHLGAAVQARSQSNELRGQGSEGDAELTARFEALPDHHDGSTAFTFELAFSEAAVDELAHRRRWSARRYRRQRSRMRGGTNPRGAGPGPSLGPVTVDAELGDGRRGDHAPGARRARMTNAACVDGRSRSRAARSRRRCAIKPFTGSASPSVPAEHGGSGTFTMELHLSEAPGGLSWRTVKGHLFEVSGGTIERARRIGAVRNRGWELTVAPAGNDDVALTLRATASCADAHHVCTSDGRKLAGGATATVPGPAALSVADAEVDEAEGATLDFVVTLSRARSGETSVDYATSDGTAVAGSDYTETSGTLTFAAGTTSQTVKVTVLDDSHDEGSETLTFTLSNPVGAALGDGEATGTIRNTDAMPQAWIARFGRTVAEQVVDAVEGRLEAPRVVGMEASLAGQPLGGAGSADDATEALERREAEGAMTALAEWLGGETSTDDGAAGFESRAVSGREVLLGSSFALTGGSAETGFGAVWGRASVSGFDGREGDLEVDGEVTSAFLGADWSRGGTTAGLAVAHSRGEGSYRSPGGDGEASSALTGVYPYGRYALSRNLSLWGVAGLGRGTLTLEPEGGARIETDLELAMGAVGLRGVLVEAPADGGMELAAKTDGMVVRTSSEAARGADGGNMAASEADVTRLRLGLQATWHGMDAGGGVLTPMMEVGVRHDGGDAETGYGADIGAGLSWSDPARGLSADLRARALLDARGRGLQGAGFLGHAVVGPRTGDGARPVADAEPDAGGRVLGRRGGAAGAPPPGGAGPRRRQVTIWSGAAWRRGWATALRCSAAATQGTPELGLRAHGRASRDEPGLAPCGGTGARGSPSGSTWRVRGARARPARRRLSTGSVSASAGVWREAAPSSCASRARASMRPTTMRNTASG